MVGPTPSLNRSVIMRYDCNPRLVERLLPGNPVLPSHPFQPRDPCGWHALRSTSGRATHPSQIDSEQSFEARVR